MADTKFTPGPWRIESHPAIGPLVRGVNDALICYVSTIGNEGANARLLAAAPELYAALEKAVEELGFAWKHEAESGGDFADDYRLALVNGQAALRKARGEA